LLTLAERSDGKENLPWFCDFPHNASSLRVPFAFDGNTETMLLSDLEPVECLTEASIPCGSSLIESYAVALIDYSMLRAARVTFGAEL